MVNLQGLFDRPIKDEICNLLVVPDAMDLSNLQILYQSNNVAAAKEWVEDEHIFRHWDIDFPS